MACFEDLPIELKEAIILEISLQDLNSLSKTCKSIRVAALPAMFRRIDFRWDPSVPDGPAITALLRSILGSPNLGKNIRELNLTAVNYRGFQAPGFNGDILLPTHTHRIPAPDWETFEKALEACPCEEKGDCDDPTTREGNLNAAIAVLISYCTRVLSLRIDVELLMHNYRLPAMLRSTLYRAIGPWGKQSWFERLTQVTVARTPSPQHLHLNQRTRVEKHYATNLLVPTDTFLKLFYLPAVETLDLMFFPNVSFFDNIQQNTLRHIVWPFPQAPMARYINTLRLRRSPALPATLGVLLATTPNLTTLEYDLLIPSSKAPVCLKTLRQALDHVRHTLKHLSVRCEVFGDDENVWDKIYDPIAAHLSMACIETLGSLHGYHALLSLETSLAILYGQVHEVFITSFADLLPPNLQRLIINDDLWDFDAFLWDDLGVLEVLRQFFAGEKRTDEWFDETYVHMEVDWVVDTEPAWKRATPHLSEFILDFEKRGQFNTEYLHRPEQRRSLQQVCEKQGISCQIKYWEDDDVPHEDWPF